MQFLGLASVVAVLAIAGVSAASTLRNHATSETTSAGTVVSDARPATTARTMPKQPERRAVPPKADSIVQQSAAVSTPVPPVAAGTTSTPASTPPAAVTTPSLPSSITPAPAGEPAIIPSTPRAGFVLVEGRSQLTDSVYAIRTGDSVLVNFDAYGFRTRRSDRIEQSLRLTLPLVFGKAATASVDTLVAGELVTEHDVIGALAKEGMRLKLDNGATAHIRILTRVVSDGPIAIGYLATIDR
jgi:hypothetical protein